MRRMFVSAWRKRRDGTVLEPMEAVIADVVGAHPEYHALLEDGSIDDDYRVEDGQTNPFLHMALHIAVREQVSVDRPPGIRHTWQRLVAHHDDVHIAEHRMLDCLAEAMMEGQRRGAPPDEEAYLDALRRL